MFKLLLRFALPQYSEPQCMGVCQLSDELKEATITVRVKPSIKAVAKKRASQMRRSLANYIEWLVERDAAEGDEPPKRRK
jgi:hypothetical protein